MGLFNSKKEDKKVDDKSLEKKDVLVDSKEAVDEKKNDKGTKKEVKNYEGDGKMAYQFIVKPWITEKTQYLMESNKYVFKIRDNVTKREAKLSVESLYGVKVESVNMVKIPQKKRRFGRVNGKKSSIKKAIVTLKKGSKIEIFE